MESRLGAKLVEPAKAPSSECASGVMGGRGGGTVGRRGPRPDGGHRRASRLADHATKSANCMTVASLVHVISCFIANRFRLDLVLSSPLICRLHRRELRTASEREIRKRWGVKLESNLGIF